MQGAGLLGIYAVAWLKRRVRILEKRVTITIIIIIVTIMMFIIISSSTIIMSTRNKENTEHTKLYA